MYLKNLAEIGYFGTLLRGLLCLSVTTVGLYMNKISKDYYYRIRGNKNKIMVRKAIEEILYFQSKIDSEINKPNITIERPSKDCAITINLSEKFENVASTSIIRQLKRVLKYLKITDGIIRIHYENDQLKFLGLIKDNKYQSVAIKHGNGWYDEQGKQLNIKYSIPNFLSLVKSSDKDKKTRISSDYGYRFHPVHKKQMFHAGIDIAAPRGSSIFAALPGKVKKIAYSKSYGTYIVLQHQSGLETFYGHLRSIDRRISVDREVSQGTRIGFVGQSGTATGPHVHFEVRLNRKHINPRNVAPIQLKLEGYELETVKKLNKFYSAQFRKLHISSASPIPMPVISKEKILTDNKISNDGYLKNTKKLRISKEIVTKAKIKQIPDLFGMSKQLAVI